MDSAKIKRNGLKGGLVALLLLAALALAGRLAAQSGPVVSVDAIPDGANTAASVGSIDTCRSAASASTFTTDVVIQGVTGITGMEAHLLYNAAVLRVTGVSYSFLIGSAGGIVLELGDLVPDTDGDFKLGVVTFPLTTASGSGVLARVTLEAVGAGTTMLDLTNVKLSDSLGGPIQPADPLTGIYSGPVNDASVVVGGTCSDADGDGYSNAAESGSPLCGNGVNDDSTDDPVTDDGCPGGPAQAGAYSEAQFNIGTDALDPCGQTAWPSDFVWGSVPDSTNRITLIDLTSFLGPMRHLGTSPDVVPPVGSAFSARWDLVPGKGVFSTWISLNDLTALLGGSSGFPPMLGGAKAFNGPACPFPP